MVKMKTDAADKKEMETIELKEEDKKEDIKPNKTKRRWITRQRIPEKALYFVQNVMIYCTHTFALNELAREWKLNYLKLGFATAMSIMNLFGALVFTSLISKLRKPRLILFICSFFYCLFFMTFFIIDQLGIGKWLEKNGVGILVFAILFSGSQFFSSGLYPALDTTILGMTYRIGASRESFAKQRLWAVVGHNFTTVLLEYVGEEIKTIKNISENPDFQRPTKPLFNENKFVHFFNAIQFYITKLLDTVGITFTKGLVTVLPIVKKDSVLPTVILVFSTLLFLVLVYFFVPKDTMDYIVGKKEENKENKDNEDKKRGRLLLKTIMKPKVAFFLFVVVCTGFVRSVITFYLVFFSEASKHMLSIPKSSPTSKPFTIFAIARGLSECLCFLFEKQLIRLLRSDSILIIVGNFLGIIRIVIYSFLAPDRIASMGFMIELLKGFNAGLFMTGAYRFIRENFPSEILSSGQGLLSGIYTGLSAFIGGLCTGLIMHFLLSKNSSKNYMVLRDVKKYAELDASEHYHAFQMVFIIAAFISIVGVGVYVLSIFMSSKKEKKENAISRKPGLKDKI